MVDRNITLSKGFINLRPLRVGDAARLYEAARESVNEISPWEDWCHASLTIDEVKRALENGQMNWSKSISYNFAIIDSRGQTILGGCNISDIDLKNRFASVGYWVRTSKTGQGIATTALRLLVDFAFKTLGLNRLEITAALGNEASHKVALKMGAKREGILRRRHVIRSEVQDVIMFSIIPSDLN